MCWYTHKWFKVAAIVPEEYRRGAHTLHVQKRYVDASHVVCSGIWHIVTKYDDWTLQIKTSDTAVKLGTLLDP